MAEVWFDMKKCEKCGDALMNTGGVCQGYCYPQCGNQNMEGYGIPWKEKTITKSSKPNKKIKSVLKWNKDGSLKRK